MADKKKAPKPTPTPSTRTTPRKPTSFDPLTSTTDPFDPPPPPELIATTLTKPDQLLLRRTMRFLVNILEPGLADRARREGYSREEHALGWQLWRTSAGETRPFEHWLREQQLFAGVDLDNEEQRRRLQEIDEFENTWFPRTRAIIRRLVGKERRDAFVAAFFKDLVQQPLGPSVVGSVGTYLTRLAGLEASTDPDAKLVRATLRARGLTNGKLAAITRLIEESQAGIQNTKPPSPQVSAADLEAARLAQLDALESLRDWWNDWAVTLRPCYNLREQLKLGLTLSKKRGSTEDAELGDEDVDEPEPEATARPLAATGSLLAS